MKQAVYKWLPIIFGCHCRDDRSFYYKGQKFPICARCTGELVGIVLGAVCFAFIRPGIPVLAVLMLPMIADGLIQLKTSYESTNIRRLWTGVLFGYALVTIFILTTIWTFNFGVSLGEKIVN